MLARRGPAPPHDVPRQDERGRPHDGVLAVVRQYGMTLEDARPGLTELYRKVLPHFVKDGKLSGLDAEHVNRLGELFGFTREYMDKLDAEELAKLRPSDS